jgi:hypothetical protein
MADDVRADDMRKRNRPADGARAHQRVVIVGADGSDLDEHVMRLRGRRGDLAEVENVDVAESGNGGGLHRVISCGVAVSRIT